ncbi:MAG: hypothetical protein HN457_08690 [Opitutales bacterium]|jgi:hypothetical protein|nr:hypothetical protein [Opitutales bacterium]MBT7864788.1 hypothetical protein [Opitutales bacterium]MDG2254670.1 hypothetical protein [Opitutaceae bacterium]
MDNINPESRFNPIARQEAQAKPNERAMNQQSAIDLSIESTAPTLKPSYTKMFDDTELERLQDNLQSIADMAEQTLERIKK